MPSVLPLAAVNHLGLMSRHVEASTRFWRDVLGFREVRRPNMNFPGAWLYNFGLMIHIIYNPAAEDPQGDIQTRANHVALHCPDLAAVEKLLTEHGVAYRRSEIRDGNIYQIFCRDPAGHHVEIGNYPATPAFVDAE